MSDNSEGRGSAGGAPYECITCGAAEWGPLPVMHGCRNCGSQDEIVPRGTRQKLVERLQDIRVEDAGNGIRQVTLDGVVVARWREGS
jgi:hypothetical protein